MQCELNGSISETLWEVKEARHKRLHMMIPFMLNIQNRQICMHRKQMSGCHRLGREGTGSDCLMSPGFLLGWGTYSVTRQRRQLHNSVERAQCHRPARFKMVTVVNFMSWYEFSLNKKIIQIKLWAVWPWASYSTSLNLQNEEKTAQPHRLLVGIPYAVCGKGPAPGEQRGCCSQNDWGWWCAVSGNSPESCGISVFSNYPFK